MYSWRWSRTIFTARSRCSAGYRFAMYFILHKERSGIKPGTVHVVPLAIAHLRQTSNLLGATPPEMLYHYTSGAALQNITGSAELWAGLPEQMNDAEELRRALRWLNLIARERELSARKENDRGDRYDFDRWAAEQSEHTLGDGRWLDDSPKSYLISLSSEGDSLSQWRAYCPDNNGYCLGLPHLAQQRG
ncbi:hypothetical protein BJF84_12570 [Rhodococcus sp. CUA-806]|nr:hypothetical protein BJF84_12570 [Rhodococcus sp. CUA-806]